MRKLSGIMAMILLALLLAACGGDEKSDKPTATVAPTTAAISTVAPTETVAVEASSPVAATAIVAVASPATPTIAASPVVVASPVSSNFEVEMTPVLVASPVVVASPVSTSFVVEMTPVIAASPVASASPAMSTPAAANVVIPELTSEATPAASPAALITLRGRVELSGNENQAYVLSDTGCVGLGANADMHEGRQLVIRNESGKIIGVTTLEASDDNDICLWTFTVDVPESTFYAVTIPMKTELVFTHDEITQSEGEITIILP